MAKAVVVGSGFSGAILSRKMAEDLGLEVLVVEKRPHIAGNMYDETDEHGILIQKYGPHFLNTDKYSIISYLERFGELFPFCVELKSFIDQKYVSLPFNFMTVQQLLGPKNSEGILSKLRAAFKGRDRVPVLELVNHPDEEISAYGNLLFQKAYRTYISKMWGMQPEEIDPYVLNRVPMAMSYDRRYLNKDFQYLPVHGFTSLFKNILDHPNITVRLNTDALDLLRLDKNRVTYCGQEVACLVYTGAIDELFGCKYGPLPYRSLDIRYRYFDEDSVLPCEVVSYPQAKGYTRSTEYRKIMYSADGVIGSVVATEYPLTYERGAAVGGTPYYPVVTEQSSAVYEKYKKEASMYENLFLCGRLAEFRYYNMDVCIEHALSYFEDIEEYLAKKL